jgi:hypothetical protein
MKRLRTTAFAALIIVLVALLATGCAGGTGAPAPEAAPDVMPDVTAEDTTFAQRAASEQALLPVAYDVRLTLDTKADRLTEHVAIEVRNDGDEDAHAAYLRFNPLGYFGYAKKQRPDSAEANKDKSAAIESVTMQGATDALPLAYAMEGTAVRVDLGDATVAPQQTATIVIDAWTDIPQNQERFGLYQCDAGKLYDLGFSFPHLDTAVDGAWAIDPPAFDNGENRNPARADFRVSVEAPAEFKVAAAGIEREGDGTTVFSVNDARDVGLVVCDFMGVDEFEAEGVSVRSYYLKTGASDAYRALEPQFVKDTFAELTSIVGPYARESYAIVQGIENGMEYSGIAVVSGAPFVDGKADDFNKTFRNTVHEVAHGWFYDAVGNVEYREGWIDEGFTSYLASDMVLMNADLPSWKLMQDYSKENPTGASYQESRRNVNERMAVKPLEGREHCFLNRPYNVYDEDDQPGDKEYVYAPTFLSKVRAAMGDEKFVTFLKDVYTTYTGKVANTEGIINLLRSHDDGAEIERLVGFFFE